MNWVQVIGELVNLGYTQPRIADECKCGQATISDLARGATSNPRFTTAQALLALLTRARRQAKRATAA